MAEFKIILFTPEHPIESEAEIVNAVIEMGAVDYVHLRHPSASEAELHSILEQLTPEARLRVRLHDHFDLISEYGLRGAHLNRRNPSWSADSMTRSCHTVDELANVEDCEYCTLSPIYSSISKTDYHPTLQLTAISQHISGKRVIALGGVKPHNLQELRKRGFAGAAVLGAFWQPKDKMSVARQLKMLRNNRFALQYITNGATPAEVEQEVKNVLAGGCRWVQVRMKNTDDAMIAEALRRVKQLCRDADAILLVDDKVELAASMRLDGVHLGRKDMAPSDARSILGDRAIIGSTANKLEQVQTLDYPHIDYAGVGPLRFTTTKKKLAPVLGLEGYAEIFAWMRSADCHLPVVAIGGITAADVPQLIDIGSSGVAVSGAIYAATDPVAATRRFLES